MYIVQQGFINPPLGWVSPVADLEENTSDLLVHMFSGFGEKNLTCLTRKTGRYSWTGQIYVLADCKLLLRPVFVNQICNFVKEKKSIGIQLT